MKDHSELADPSQFPWHENPTSVDIYKEIRTGNEEAFEWWMEQFEDDISLEEVWSGSKRSTGPLRAAIETKNLGILRKILDRCGPTLLRSRSQKKEKGEPDVTRLIREALEAHDDDAVSEILSRAQNLKDIDIFQFFDAALHRGLDQRAIEFLGHCNCEMSKTKTNIRRRWLYMQTAVRYGRPAVVQFLIDRRDFNPNIDLDRGWNALQLVAKYNQIAVGRFLTQRGKCRRSGVGGPAKTAYNAGHIEFLVLIFLEIPPESEDDDQGWVLATKLLKAARDGDLPTVEKIISQPDAPINPFSDGPTPLHLTIKNRHTAVVEVILQTGMADVDRAFACSNSLSEAILQHNGALFRQLLNHSKIDSRDDGEYWNGPTGLVRGLKNFCKRYGTAEILDAIDEKIKASESIPLQSASNPDQGPSPQHDGSANQPTASTNDDTVSVGLQEEPFNMDFGSMDTWDILEEFDFDTFLHTDDGVNQGFSFDL